MNELRATTILLALALAMAPSVSISSGQPPTASEDVVFVGAGDIANCELLSGATATAALLDGIEGTIFTLGDHAYANGTKAEFAKCYGPTWGRHKARTRPTPGNHDYLTERGRPYFDYFGDAAGSREKGYYSFDLGAWHIISLNSSIPERLPAQVRWLREDLAANPVDCVLAYWHEPVFSSGPHTPEKTMLELWSILYKAGADIVMNGHDHLYERFAPQDDRGRPAAGGIRQFIVGTGGGGVYRFGRVAANSEVRDNTSYGVLKLTLGTGRYAWEFVPTPSSRFRDSGTGTCSPQRPSGP